MSLQDFNAARLKIYVVIVELNIIYKLFLSSNMQKELTKLFLLKWLRILKTQSTAEQKANVVLKNSVDAKVEANHLRRFCFY